ncbi:MAG: DUF5063 domain-containing protein [Bacteroidales bacterium]|nr:DUF5063 domain-containing protein [Bacteroidales bacterium]
MIYSKEVVEFLTVAAEFVRYVESLSKTSKQSLFNVSQKLLPLLYLKTAMLPAVTPLEEDELEKFVTEENWNFVKNSVSKILGEQDVWMVVNEPLMQLEDEGISVCISECYADIYQDLSDFIQSYRMGNESIMNDALFVCKQNFEQFWGPRLLATLSTLHHLIYGKEEEDGLS